MEIANWLCSFNRLFVSIVIAISASGFADGQGPGNGHFYPVAAKHSLPANIKTPSSDPNTPTSRFNTITVFADQMPGTDLCSKVQAASQVPNAGIVDVSRLAGTVQTCESSVSISNSGLVVLFPADITVTVMSGVTISFTGNDILWTGSGNTTIFDFSVGTSSNNNFLVRGNRVTLANFTVIGNRVAGGTSNAISLRPTSGVVDRDTVSGVTVLNSGGRAIYASGVTNATIANNIWRSSRLSGFFLDRPYGGQSNRYVTVANNVATDYNLSDNTGDGGIMLRGALVTDNLHILIRGNYLTLNAHIANGVGIGVNGADHVDIFGNRIKQNIYSGECIAVTANNFRIHHNESSSCGAAGLLVYENTTFYEKGMVSDNTIQDGTPGMVLAWGSDDVTLTDIDIYNNRDYGTQTFGFQSTSGFTGMGVSNVRIHNNLLSGNIGATNLLADGVRGVYHEWGNTSALAENHESCSTYFATGGAIDRATNEINYYLSPTGSFSTPIPDSFGPGCYYGSCPDWTFRNYLFSYVLPDGTTASLTNLKGSSNFTNPDNVVTEGTASGYDSTGTRVRILVKWRWRSVCEKSEGACEKQFAGGALTVTK